jgi:hypothetical protein
MRFIRTPGVPASRPGTLLARTAHAARVASFDAGETRKNRLARSALDCVLTVLRKKVSDGSAAQRWRVRFAGGCPGR